MFLHYLLLTTLSMIGLLWLLIRLSRRGKLPPDGGDDGGGGFGDDNLPIIDLPPGSGLDDWLTDRIPETPTSTIKKQALEKA